MKIAGMKAVGDASAGLVQCGGIPLHGPIAGQRPFIQAQPRGPLIHARLVPQYAAWRRKVLGALEPDIVFGRFEIGPIGGGVVTAGIHRDRLATDVGGAGLAQQRLDDHFRLFVGAFAKKVMADTSLRIDEIERRPGLVPECAPDGMVVVDRDRVVDLHVFHGPANVGDVLFELELRRMDADHHQSLVLVFLGPGADIRKLAPPVDAGVGPEIDQNDLAAQSLRRQRRRIQPFVRAVKRRQLVLTGRRADWECREGTEPALRSTSSAGLSFR